MIVINVLIWGYAAVEIVPLIIGDSEAAVATTDPRVQADTAHQAQRERMPQHLRAEQAEDWEISDPVAFFSGAIDPFRPVIVPAESRPATAAATTRPGQRIPGYTVPGADSVRQPVTTSYRLSGLMEIGNTVVALLTTGAGAGAQAVQAERGQTLPDGSRVREVNFKDNYVILVKERHVFKLIDYSPWVLLLESP